MTIVEIIERLADMKQEAMDYLPMGWDIPEALHPDYSDLVLDMLGVPKEAGTIANPSSGNCRDGAKELWQQMSAHEFLSIMAAWFPDELSAAGVELGSLK